MRDHVASHRAVLLTRTSAKLGKLCVPGAQEENMNAARLEQRALAAVASLGAVTRDVRIASEFDDARDPVDVLGAFAENGCKKDRLTASLDDAIRDVRASAFIDEKDDVFFTQPQD